MNVAVRVNFAQDPAQKKPDHDCSTDRAEIRWLEAACRIVTSLRHPIEGGERIYRLSGSVGIALRDGSPSGTLFVMADTALYAAKAAGRDTFRLYAPSVGEAIERRRRAHDVVGRAPA